MSDRDPIIALDPVGGRGADASAPTMRRAASRIARTARQREAAPGGRTDRIVGFCRVILPVLIGVLAAFLVMAPLTMAGDVSFLLDKNKVEVAKERLRIEAATYRGQDANGRPFALTAGSAVQKSSSEPVVMLDRLAARIDLADGPARLIAGHGRYNMDTQRVSADGPVRFASANGYRLDTSDAVVDLRSRRLTSGGAVTGQVPQGSFSGARLSADLERHIVTLDGHARLRIVPHRAKARPS